MQNPFKKTKTTRMIFFAVLDVLCIALALWLSFLVRFDGNIPAQFYPLMERVIGLAVIFTLPVFYVKRLYSFSWAYVSSSELISLFQATTISFAFLAIAIFVSDYFPHFLNFPRSTLVMGYVLVLLFCGATRLSKRMWLHSQGLRHMENKTPTLIIGAGDAGEQLLRNMLSSRNNPYFPVGFVDDSPIKQGVAIHGLRVLGTIGGLPGIIASTEAKQVIVAMPSASNRIVRNIIESARAAGIRKIKVAPQLHEVMRGEISLKNLRDVDAADLLGRGEITLDSGALDHFIKGKRLLVTGAAGSIGSELCRQVARFKPSRLLMLDQDETGIFNISKEMTTLFPGLAIEAAVADICDQEKIQAIFGAFKPAVIFHAAAYKHVPLMEAQPDQAVKNNVFGTEALARASVEHGAEKFIFISTDKAVNPTSVMGATKRLGEMVCQAWQEQGKTKFISVRFGNVLDSRGSVIPIFREQIKRGGPVEVTHPQMQRYFMLIPEACLLVMQAGAMGRGGEVFVLDMGKPVKILDLAREMIQLSGFVPDVDIAITFIGTRPGEKLFEELLGAEEGTLATGHQKIFAAKLAPQAKEVIRGHLERLRGLAREGNSPKILEVLKSIIPYYK